MVYYISGVRTPSEGEEGPHLLIWYCYATANNHLRYEPVAGIGKQLAAGTLRAPSGRPAF